MSSVWRRPGPYVAYPDDRAPAILGSPARDALGLDIAAWSESSRYALDGRLSVARARSIAGWSAFRQGELVKAGFWRLDADVVELVAYLEFNNSRARILDIKGKRSEAGRARVEGDPRDDAGRVTGDRRVIDGQLTGHRRAIDGASVEPFHAQPSSTLLGPSTSSSTSVPPTPTSGGRGSRANGTNHRAIARRQEEARLEAIRERNARVQAIRIRYAGGQLTEAQRDAAIRALGPAPA